MSLGVLKRKTEEISVLVDGEERRFRLSARSIADQLEMISQQAVGKAIAMGYLEEHISLPSPVLRLRAAHAIWLSQIETVVSLLSDPVDGKPALTEEEFWKLETGEPDRVIATQERLTNMDTVLGNGDALLAEVKARMSKSPGSPSGRPSPKQD